MIRAAAGDGSAFETLYHKYNRRVYRIVFRITGSAQETEDVVQEVYLQAFKNLGSFQGRSRFSTWLYRIATNVSLHHLKRMRRRGHDVSYEDTDEARQIPSRSPDSNPEHAVESRGFLRELDRALMRLVPNQRVAMILSPIHGYNYTEVAKLLGTTGDVVKSRIHRAREHIRELLKEFRDRGMPRTERNVTSVTAPA